MSRIGKNPVSVPSGVQAQLAGRTLTVNGSLGTLSLTVGNDVTAQISDGTITIAPVNDTKQARAMWGTTRASINNMVTRRLERVSRSVSKSTGSAIARRCRARS